MKIYELRCINQDGQTETNGFYRYLIDAQGAKIQMDKLKENTRYGIEQSILTHEVKE